MLDPIGFVIAIVVAIVGYRLAAKKQQQRSLDGYTIKKLEDSGMDISSEHEIEFWFYSNNEAGIKKVVKELQQREFEVQFNETEEDPRYVIIAVKQMIPELSSMQILRNELVQIAKSNGVEYDGWGCSK